MIADRRGFWLADLHADTRVSNGSLVFSAGAIWKNIRVYPFHPRSSVAVSKLCRDQCLSAEEVEAAFDRVVRLEERRDGSFRMLAEVPSGRRVWVVWRYDRENDEVPDVFGEVDDPPIFVVTAY